MDFLSVSHRRARRWCASETSGEVPGPDGAPESQTGWVRISTQIWNLSPEVVALEILFTYLIFINDFKSLVSDIVSTHEPQPTLTVCIQSSVTRGQKPFGKKNPTSEKGCTDHWLHCVEMMESYNLNVIPQNKVTTWLYDIYFVCVFPPRSGISPFVPTPGPTGGARQRKVCSVWSNTLAINGMSTRWAGTQTQWWISCNRISTCAWWHVENLISYNIFFSTFYGPTGPRFSSATQELCLQQKMPFKSANISWVSSKCRLSKASDFIV